jgi:hypothetical protein
MMKTENIVKLVILNLTVLCSIGPGCTEEDNPGEGTLSLELWGEEYIEQGIPKSAFVDGFSITFDKFLINLGKISVAKEGTSPEIEEPHMKIWDLTKQGPFSVVSVTAPAGEYHHTAYTIAKSTSGSTSGNAEESDVQTMKDGGLSIYISGAATDGTITKTFVWEFHTETVYDPCHSEAQFADGGQATVQITIHGDHLFYDDAVSEDPSLRFMDIALADADGDNEITKEELADYDITPLPNYGVGSLDVDNLWDFISHMTSTLGHIDGEGHCD